MKIDLKRALLAGAAVVAVSGFTASANAQDFTIAADFVPNVAADAIWASSAGATGADLQNATEGQTVDVNGFQLWITDGAPAGIDGDPAAAAPVPADGGTAGLLSVGAITDSGAGDVVVMQSAGELNATIASVTVGDDFNINNVDAADDETNVTVTGAATVGDDFNVISTETDNAAGDIFVTVGGALSVTGASQITAGDLAGGGSITFVSVAGNTTFGEAVTIDGGANNAGNTATLELYGATNTFTGGVFLDDNTGVAQLGFAGASAQTAAGDITSGGATEGLLYVSNASGVTFSRNVSVGNMNVFGANGGLGSAATFNGNVTFTSAALGNGGGTETNAVSFSSSGTLTVTGNIEGDGAGNDTAQVNVLGGGTIVQATSWGTSGNVIDLIAVSGSSELDSDAEMFFTSATVASGSTLDVGAGALTGNIINSGTIHQTGTGTITGDITGTGVLDVDANTTYTGNVAGTSANIAAGVTLNFGGANTFSVTNTTLAGAGSTLALAAANQTVSGNVLAGTDDQGVLSVADGGVTHAFTGNIGSSTNQLATFNVLGGAGNTVTSTGNIFANAIGVNDADEVQLIGTTAQTVSGIVTGGDWTIGSGATASDVTFSSHLISTDAFTVSDLASVTFAGNRTGSQLDVEIATLDLDGTMTVNSGVAVQATNWTDDADANTDVLRFVANGSGGVTDIGKLWVTTGAVNLTDENIVFVVDANSGALTPGTINFLSAQAGNAVTFTSANISDTSFLYDFDVNLINAAQDIASVTITAVDLTTATTTGNNATVANILLNDATLQASTDANLNALQGSIQAATTQQEFNDALEQAQPTVDGSSVAGTLNVVNNSFSIVGDRLASVRQGDTVTGMTTGNISSGVRAWLQGFGAHGEQDQRDGIDGYDFDSYGMAFGMDTENMFRDTVVGVAFSYADTDADSDNAARTNTNTDSYQFTVYGEHDFDPRTYLNGMLAYSHNETDTSRTVVNAQANGQFDADVFTVRAELGRDYEYDTATLTPHVLTHWTHYNPDGYTETGAGGAGLVVDQDSVDIFELGVGLDVSWLFQNADGSYFSPEISVGYRYDFADDDVEMTSQYIAGGAAFSTSGFDPQQSTLNGGVGFTYFTTENWELTAEYDYEWKEDFDSHAGMARAAYRF